MKGIYILMKSEITYNSEVYSEVWDFLNLIGETYIKKIPHEILSYINKNRKKDYRKNINILAPITDQNLKQESLEMISFFNLRYWCTDNSKKQYAKQKFIDSEMKKLEKINIKFNLNNLSDIFDIPKNESPSLTIIKENVFIRLLKRIKNFFWKYNR